MLVFDGRFIRVGKHDGISRFSAELINELSKIRPLTVMISDLGQLRHLPEGIAYFLECAPTSIREMGLAFRLNRMGVSKLYSPMQTTGKFGAKFPVILTLHDLIYYQHRQPPAEFNILVRALWRVYHWSFVPARLVLRKANGLVTISETSKTLIQQNKLFSGPMEVIYNSANLVSTRRKVGAASKQICYMGSFMAYKDVETIVRAAGLAKLTVHLLSAISDERRLKLENLAEVCGSAIIFHNGVTDSTYEQVLTESLALISASRAEGFGIPVIEAMGVGIPVVCTDIPIFREVGGEAALYFKPGNAEQLAQALKSLKAEWNERSQKSLANAHRFSWSESARRLADFIDRVN